MHHRQMKRAALAAKALLPHLNNATASRHVILFTCDSHFVLIELHPLLKESLIVHLGDDAFASSPTMHNYVGLQRAKNLLRNAVVVPYRVSQWLPFGFMPPVIGLRALLVSMNVNVARHPIRKSIAAQLVADAERLNLTSKRVLVSSKMLGPKEAALVALNSTFCVCPTGDSKGFTARFYFVMMHGCVPVRLDGWRRNVTRAPPTYPFPTLIDWSKIVIDMAVEKLEPQGLLSRLLHMSPQEVAERQRLLRHSLHWLTYDLKNHSHHDAPAALIHTIQEALARAIAHFSTLSPGLRGDEDACMHHAMKETGSVLLFEVFSLLLPSPTPSPRLGAGGGWAGFAGGGLYFRVGHGFGRLAVARVRRWVGMVVRFGCPCVPCLSRVPCVSRLPPVSFYRYSTGTVCPGSPRCLPVCPRVSLVCPAAPPGVFFRERCLPAPFWYVPVPVLPCCCVSACGFYRLPGLNQ